MSTPVEPLPGLPSEVTEPYLARTIGHLWQRFERSKKELSDYKTIWDSVRALNLLATIASDGIVGTHASIACSNAISKLRTYIERETGMTL